MRRKPIGRHVQKGTESAARGSVLWIDVTTTAPAHVLLRTRCPNCQREIELECKGLQGFWGYNTYNEYFCPYCRKQNHQLCSGTVVSVRPLTHPVLEAPKERGWGLR
jgi:hypothetical protein